MHDEVATIDAKLRRGPLTSGGKKNSAGAEMKFGVFDHIDDAGVPLGQLYADRLRIAEAYDRAGFYGYHVAEHHSTPLGAAASPALIMAALAYRTKNLRFGPLVYLLPFYHPLRLIEEVCMLDQMSGGRFQLGVGRGVSHLRNAAYGLDFSKTQAMYHEAFQVLLKGLASDELTFAGRVLPLRQGADDPAAGAEAASAAVVRRHAAEQLRLARGERRQHRRARTARQHQRHHQGLPRDAREARLRS